MQWPVPKNVEEIRSFMGITCYYRIFAEGFSKLVYPITYFQKKGIKFEWSQKCQKNFEKLKQLFNTNPILKLVDPNKDSLLCRDACEEDLGGVFMQGGHVICYESRKLKEHEKNYATYDLELATIILTFKMWRHYL